MTLFFATKDDTEWHDVEAPVIPETHQSYEWQFPAGDGPKPRAAEIHAALVAAGIGLHDGVTVTGDGRVIVVTDQDPTDVILAVEPAPAPPKIDLHAELVVALTGTDDEKAAAVERLQAAMAGRRRVTPGRS